MKYQEVKSEPTENLVEPSYSVVDLDRYSLKIILIVSGTESNSSLMLSFSSLSALPFTPYPKPVTWLPSPVTVTSNRHSFTIFYI